MGIQDFFTKKDSSVDSIVTDMLPSGISKEADEQYSTRGTVVEVVQDHDMYLVLLSNGVFAINYNDECSSLLEIALLRQAKENKKPVTIRGLLFDMEDDCYVKNAPRYGIDIESIEL